jgi:hypothetical protein
VLGCAGCVKVWDSSPCVDRDRLTLTPLAGNCQRRPARTDRGEDLVKVGSHGDVPSEEITRIVKGPVQCAEGCVPNPIGLKESQQMK